MSTLSPQPQPRSKIITLIIVLSVAVATILLTLSLQGRLTGRSDKEFAKDTNTFTQKMMDDIESYNNLLYAGRGLLTSSQLVEQQEWETFFSSQASLDRYGGLSSIYYVELVPASERSAFERRMRAVPFFGEDFSVKPLTPGAREYAVASLVYTNNDVSATLGYDNFSSPERRDTYRDAEARNKPTASQPLPLRSGPLGFYIALPVFGPDQRAIGYIGASFRADDFLTSIIRQEPTQMALKIADVTDIDKPIDLYGSDSWDATPDQLRSTNIINVAGRVWQVEYKTKRSYDQERINRDVPRLMLAIGTLVILIVLLGYARHVAHHSPKSS